MLKIKPDTGADPIKETLNNSLFYCCHVILKQKPQDYMPFTIPNQAISPGLAHLGRSYPAVASSRPLAWYRFAKAISENTCAAFLAKPL